MKIQPIAKSEPNIEPNLAPLVLSKVLNINVLTVSERSQKRTQCGWSSGFKFLILSEPCPEKASKRTQPLGGPKRLVDYAVRGRFGRLFLPKTRCGVDVLPGLARREPRGRTPPVQWGHFGSHNGEFTSSCGDITPSLRVSVTTTCTLVNAPLDW